MGEKIYREFRFELDDDERIERSRQLVKLIRDLDDLLAAKKEISADYKSRIDACDAEIRLTAGQIETGAVNRQIECEWRTDPTNATIRRLVRLDTNQTVEIDEIKGDNLFGGQTSAGKE